MTAEEKMAWLQTLCSKDETRIEIASPFAGHIGDTDYVCATTGHSLTGLVIPEVKARTDGPDISAVWNPGDWHTIPMAALREWATADRKPRGAKCKACGGVGFIPSDVVAFDEYGDGPIDDLYEKCHECGREKARCGVVGKSVFNRNLVADAIERVDGEEAEWSVPAPKDSPLLLRGPGWIAAIMPIREDLKGPVLPGSMKAKP
jgi:hypothetical protein